MNERSPNESNLLRTRLATLVESAAYPFFSCAIDGTVLWLNRKFKEAVGIEVGTNIGEVIHPDDVVYAAGQFASLLEGANQVQFTIRLPLRDGEYHALDVDVSAMVDEVGDAVELVGSVGRIEDSSHFDDRLR